MVVFDSKYFQKPCTMNLEKLGSIPDKNKLLIWLAAFFGTFLRISLKQSAVFGSCNQCTNHLRNTPFPIRLSLALYSNVKH